MSFSDEVIERLIAGGKVQRCHTIPHQGSYSVAEHSWRAAIMYLTMEKEPNFRVLKALLMHDCHEAEVGDLPSSSDPELYQKYKEVCKRVDQELGIDFELTEKEQWKVDYFDKSELLLWAHEQHTEGNQHVEVVIERLADWLAGHAAKWHTLTN